MFAWFSPTLPSTVPHETCYNHVDAGEAESQKRMTTTQSNEYKRWFWTIRNTTTTTKHIDNSWTTPRREERETKTIKTPRARLTTKQCSNGAAVAAVPEASTITPNHKRDTRIQKGKDHNIQSQLKQQQQNHDWVNVGRNNLKPKQILQMPIKRMPCNLCGGFWTKRQAMNVEEEHTLHR